MSDNAHTVQEDDTDVNQSESSTEQNDSEQSGSATTGGGDAPWDVSPEYHMPLEERKVSIIVNNKFPKGKGHGLTKRNGTDADCDKMKALLSGMAFEGHDGPEIVVKRDLSYDEMVSLFTNVSSGECLQGASCLVVVILSYGNEGYFYGMDRRMEVNKLINYFKANECKPLAGKPKLFFLQTCTKEADPVVPQAAGESHLTMTLPNESDILVVQSWIPGRLTWATDPSQGSLFISTLAGVMNEFRMRCDVTEMMTIVLKKLSKKLSENQITDQQLPSVYSTLCKYFFFESQL